MGFDRLHPSIQHHVVNSLGWRDLRPLQEESIGPILEGEHCLLIAPTAGGKTEAALLPILSRMLEEEWNGLSVLYVCPIRALLNNLEERVSYYCSLVGRRCGLWHGDVGQASRADILRDPPDILLTTPESLEAILISRRTDRNHFFGNLRTVVIDEIHSFAADDRGWHLLAVTERIAALAGRRPQRIGLSATVGNPDAILSWMTRDGASASRVVSPTGQGGAADADVQLDYVGSIENAALVISRLHRGTKRLVFTDSRSQAERLASLLRHAGTSTFVSHSSLSVDDRRQAERAFRDSRDCVIVATSTLELGIDVGDLDHVIQLESPTTVASFLQRLGRTGRRPGSRRNCLFLATHRESLVQAAALLRLWRSGYVEPLLAAPEPFPVVAQQVMATIRQKGGASRRFDGSAIETGVGMGAEITETLIAHMLESGILFEDSGVLGIGRAGELLYGAKNFMPLMSVFDTPSLFQVLCGAEELGWVHPLSFHGFGQRPVVISLGGRAWEVIRLDEDHSIAHVKVSSDPHGKSRWLGGNRALRPELCGAARSVLLDRSEETWWSKRARVELEKARSEATEVHRLGLLVEQGYSPSTTKWWTFGGLKANYSLALLLRTPDGVVPRFDNFFVEIPGAGGLKQCEEKLQNAAGRDAATGDGLVEPPKVRVKFWDCLPEQLQRRYAAARYTDPVEARRVLDYPRVYSDRVD